MTLLILPFLIELFGDYYLIKKGKKDISALWRVEMILLALLLVPGNSLNHLLQNISLAIIPYAFFDPLLNLLRGKPILYTGKTKMYDLFLSKFPSWVVLVGRFIFAGVLLLIYYSL